MTESSLIPAADAGIRLYVREKCPADLTQFRSDRILLIVHGATWQALHQTITPTCLATAAPLGRQKLTALTRNPVGDDFSPPAYVHSLIEIRHAKRIYVSLPRAR